MTTPLHEAAPWTSFKYYTVEEIREEFEARGQARSLVAEWWMENGFGMPDIPETPNPMAKLARSVATTRYEDIAFCELAKQAELTAVWSELHGDTFSTDSSYKKSCVDRRVVTGRGRNGGLQVRREKLFTGDIRTLNGTPMGELVAPSGETVVQFHQRLHDELFGEDARRCELTDWIKGDEGRRAIDYYVRYLSLFVGHTVLFEDFHGGESGMKLELFMRRVVNPAYVKVRDLFGIAPMIVPMPWELEFSFYPEAGTDWREHGII